MRMLAEERRDFAVVKIDMENAFNEVSRASMIEAFEEEPSLQHLRGHAAVVFIQMPSPDSRVLGP